MGTSQILVVLTLTCVPAGAAAGESVVTVRLGEQDTCGISGVTKLTWDDRAGAGHIRFDVGKLPRGAGVRKAVLRFWVAGTGEGGRACRTWGFERWREDGFEGFRVYRGPAPEAGKLLDTKFPFEVPTYWCFEFDVTPAVRDWLRDPRTNDGLCTNFRFPVAPDGPDQTAWQRPYLQVTYAGPNPNRPKQPTDLEAFCRSGQVFVTWRQVPHTGAFFDSTYRVYRHAEPITAANLDRAELLGEVHRLSQLNYRRTLTARGGDYGPWRHYVSAAGEPTEVKGESRQQRFERVRKLIPERFNFVIDDAWPRRIDGGRFLTEPKPSDRVQIHQGPPLSDETGLFVHTVRKAARACFAVTSVLNGNENRRDFGGGNSLARPVACAVAPPRPVPQAVFTANGPEGYRKIGKFQVREYVYWEGGGGRLHNEPSTPLAFCFHVPRRWVNLGYEHNANRDVPPWLVSNAKVAGYSVHYWNGRGLVMDTGYVPPTRRAPFPPGRSSNMAWPDYSRLYYGSATPPARGEAGPWWFCRSVYGYVETLHTGADPRRATIRPYFENRRLFELDFVLSSFPADANYVAAVGESAALNFAIHHADRIGCAECSQERPWNSPGGAPAHEPLVGLRRWALKGPRGVDVWQWNDPVWLSRHGPRRPWPAVSNTHSPNYNSADNWGALGFPRFYLDLAAERRVNQLWWCDIGDAPNGKFLAVPRDQAYPVLSRASCCETPLPKWKSEPRGTLNGYVVWHRPARPFLRPARFPGNRKPPDPPPGRRIAYADRRRNLHWAAVPLDLVDEPRRIEMALRIGEDGLMLNGQSVPPCRVACGAADVTPRRLQRFGVAKGRRYLWRNVKVATGRLLQAGVIAPDERGRLTVPGFLLDKDLLGNKLIVEPANGSAPPAVDGKQTVRITYYRTPADRRAARNVQTEELPYPQYLRRCRAPELVPVVKAEKVFRIDDFVNTRGFRDGGLYSMWGGGFDDAFLFPQAGRYRVEVETTRSHFASGAWPILSLHVDDRPAGERLLDANAPIRRTWWIDVPKGRHRVRFRLANNVFNEPVPRNGDQSPKPDRGFALVGVRFVPLGERPARPGEVYQVAIRQRSAVLPPGMPLRMRADVLDGSGQPLRSRIRWTASAGAVVSPDGLFRAAKAGTCRVTATAGDKSDTVTVTAAGDAWVEDFDDEWPDGWHADGGRWTVTRKTGFVGALVQRDPTPGAPHRIVWQGGAEWGDLTLRVDRLLPERNLPGGSAQGVVFRYRDADNHYRFEQRLAEDGPELRLVARVGGTDTVIASASGRIPPLAMARATCASLRHWSERWRTDPKPLRIDRFEVQLRGRRIAAKLNGRGVFDVAHGAAARGTVALCCRGGAAFDNVTVTPR